MAIEFPLKADRNPQRAEMFEVFAERMRHDNPQTAVIRNLAKAYRELVDQQARINRDETSTAGAKLVRLAKAARSKIVPLIDSLDAASVSNAEQVASLQAQLINVYDPPGKGYEVVMRHQEVRAHFRRAPRGEALKMLQVAQDTKDEDTLIALASVQHFLSGLPPEVHQQTRDVLIDLKAPHEAATLAAIRDQQRLANQFRESMVSSVGAMVDFRRADEIVAAAREDAAA